jgi:phenylacetate-CoA ligase
LQSDDFAYPIVTSGSTGVAVRLIGTFDTACYWQALSMRDHFWHQRDFSKTLAAIRWAKRNVALPPLGEPSDHWGVVTEGIVETGGSFFLNVASSTRDQLKWLQMINPYYLLSYPSQLKVLLRYLIDEKIILANIREIRTIGETVDAELIALAQQYGVKLTDIYSAEEFGIIAIQCPEHNNYHVQSENVIVEIVDENGHACAPGQEGRVIVTNLHNFATPLLRYEIGDYAQSDAPCPCGRNALPTLKKIHGRKRNRLTLANGETLFPYLGDREEYREITLAVKKFQMIQHSPQRIECKLVVDTPLTQDQESRYANLIKKNLGHDFDIELTYHQDIPRQPNGKFEEFISLLP